MQHNISYTIIWLQNTMLNPKYTANSKIQYNYNNNNCIPELLTVNSCWNCVNILASHKVWCISYVPLLSGVHQLFTTVWVFDVRCESVTHTYTHTHTHIYKVRIIVKIYLKTILIQMDYNKLLLLSLFLLCELH